MGIIIYHDRDAYQPSIIGWDRGIFRGLFVRQNICRFRAAKTDTIGAQVPDVRAAMNGKEFLFMVGLSENEAQYLCLKKNRSKAMNEVFIINVLPFNFCMNW